MGSIPVELNFILKWIRKDGKRGRERPAQLLQKCQVIVGKTALFYPLSPLIRLPWHHAYFTRAGEKSPLTPPILPVGVHQPRDCFIYTISVDLRNLKTFSLTNFEPPATLLHLWNAPSDFLPFDEAFELFTKLDVLKCQSQYLLNLTFKCTSPGKVYDEFI